MGYRDILRLSSTPSSRPPTREGLRVESTCGQVLKVGFPITQKRSGAPSTTVPSPVTSTTCRPPQRSWVRREEEDSVVPG